MASRQPPTPSLTSMQWAFLTALLRWAELQTHSSITLPVGKNVDPEELRRVLHAITRVYQIKEIKHG